MKPNSTCKDCAKRTEGCHAICDDYKKFKEECDRYNEVVRENKEKHGIIEYKKGGKTWIR